MGSHQEAQARPAGRGSRGLGSHLGRHPCLSACLCIMMPLISRNCWLTR